MFALEYDKVTVFVSGDARNLEAINGNDWSPYVQMAADLIQNDEYKRNISRK